MRYAGIIENDMAAAPGVCLTFFTQGCPHHCKNCHNPETWDFDGGKIFDQDVINEVINKIKANGFIRPLCIMGGEPLCDENRFVTELLISNVKEKYPSLPIYLWTGYIYEKIKDDTDPRLQYILKNITAIIDGPYIDELRNVSLPMRGSENQRIIVLKEKK